MPYQVLSLIMYHFSKKIKNESRKHQKPTFDKTFFVFSKFWNFWNCSFTSHDTRNRNLKTDLKNLQKQKSYIDVSKFPKPKFFPLGNFGILKLSLDASFDAHSDFLWCEKIRSVVCEIITKNYHPEALYLIQSYRFYISMSYTEGWPHLEGLAVPPYFLVG